MVGRRVKNDPEKMSKAAELINSDSFKTLIDEASNDPEGAAAKAGVYMLIQVAYTNVLHACFFFF